MKPVKEAVLNAYLNAIEGGYEEELEKMTDEELTDDMMDRDADVAQYPRQEVLASIIEYRSNRHRIS